MAEKKLNLFFLRKGYYECVVTTKDTITRGFDRKITVALHPAQEWLKCTLVGALASVPAPVYAFKKLTDEKYVFIDCRDWMFDKKYPLFLALPKEVLSGNEHYTKDLEETICGSSCNAFLFPMPPDVKGLKVSLPNGKIMFLPPTGEKVHKAVRVAGAKSTLVTICGVNNATEINNITKEKDCINISVDGVPFTDFADTIADFLDQQKVYKYL